jgi:large repetitive protein
LAESQPAGTLIGSLTSTDVNPGDAHTYSLACAVPGTGDASFQIGGAANDELQTSDILDFETQNIYNICLRTDDGNGGTYDKSFVINVTDVPGLELVVPLNSVILLTNRPTFDWANYAGAIGYNIQIARNSGFTQLVSNTNLTGATNSSYTPAANLLAKTNMWWRVRAKLTATTYSGWSDVRSFTTANPPPAPVLTAPVNNVLVTTATTFLNWNDVTMPSGTTFQKYEIVFASNSTFTTGLISIEAALSEANSPTLTPNTKVYWHVRAYNTLGQYGAWSASRYFRVALPAPNTLLPGVVTPPGSANNIHMRRPTFTWDVVAGATNYTLEVSTTSAFTIKAINKTATGVSYTHTADLAANTTFFWRVKTNGANGPSLYSQVRTFTTGNPPSIPTLSAPANNALVTSTTPLLDWSNATVPTGAPGFYKYEVQLSRNADFSTIAAEINAIGLPTDSQTSSPTLLNGTTYYWRVHSVNVGVDGIGGNADDDLSGWSASRSLRTPFAAPSLTQPLDLATGVALKPAFQWLAISGASNYTLQVSTSPSFATLAINKVVTGTTYTHTLNLSAGTLFYWRVRANGPFGPGLWQSLVFSFTTAP